jgi:hypothetical protein
MSSVFIILSFLFALLADPTIVSPATNDPEIIETSRIFVIELQDLTLAVVLLIEPVTTSLKI